MKPVKPPKICPRCKKTTIKPNAKLCIKCGILKVHEDKKRKYYE